MSTLNRLVNSKKFTTEAAKEIVDFSKKEKLNTVDGGDLLTRLSDTMTEQNKALITTLVERDGINIDTLNSDNKTALAYVLNKDNVNIAEALFLIRLGASPDAANDKGNTLLHILAKSPIDYSVEIQELIKTHKADFQKINGSHETALDVGLKTVEEKKTTTANAYQLIQNCRVMFKESTQQELTEKPGDFSTFNQLIRSVHSVNDKNAYALQGTMKEILFKQFTKSIKNLSPEEKLQKLELARKEPIFAAHRSHFFLAKMGRTNTVILIDKMIAQITKELSESNTSTATSNLNMS